MLIKMNIIFVNNRMFRMKKSTTSALYNYINKAVKDEKMSLYIRIKPLNSKFIHSNLFFRREKAWAIKCVQIEEGWAIWRVSKRCVAGTQLLIKHLRKIFSKSLWLCNKTCFTLQIRKLRNKRRTGRSTEILSKQPETIC